MRTLILFFLLQCTLFAQETNRVYADSKTEKENQLLLDLSKKHFTTGNYDSCSYFAFKVIEKTNPTNLFNIKAHVVLGLMFINTYRFSEAEKYFKAALNKAKDSTLLGQIYANLGMLDFQRNQYSKALVYFKKAINFNSDDKSFEYQSNLSNIGAAYIHLKKPRQALPYILDSKRLAKKMDDKIGVSIAINNLATIYRDLNQQDSALYYYQKALQMVDEVGSKEEKKTILYNLSEIYEQKGNVNLAFAYYKKYIVLKEELFNTEKNKFIVETQEKYQTAKRLKDLAELKVKIQRREVKHKQFVFNLVLVILSLSIIFIGLVIWYRWKAIQTKNKTKVAIISATLEGEEKQRLKISQEIHDDLGGLLGVCRMMFTKSRQIFTETNKELFERIDQILIQANNRSRAISHELFSPTLKQFGLQAAIQEHIHHLRLVNPDLEVIFEMEDFRLDPSMELNCFRITQELFTNTIKYANATSISLEIKRNNQHLSYCFCDNGKGFDVEQITKGVGLNSIEARVKSFSGKVEYLSNNGFIINISLPLSKNV